MSDQPAVQINNTPTADHDLLIRLDEKVTTKFEALEKQIGNLSDNLVDRVTDLENDYKEYRKANDARVSSLQRLVYVGLGILLALQFISIVYVTFFRSGA